MTELAEASVPVHAVAHQFEDAHQQKATATLGMWVFLATEVMFFGGLITGFVIYRFLSPEIFARGSHKLNVLLGTINTWVLLTSSLTMALAVHAGQTGSRKEQVRYLLATILLGSVFLGIKGVEYHEEYENHRVPGLNFRSEVLPQTPETLEIPDRRFELFFVFYFFMTGLHALHMVIGIGVLAVLVVMAHRGRFTPEYNTPLELSGLYWHFIDIVWVFLFPLLYLIDLYKKLT
jgi:cytochrome c oxidase subunit 3